MTEATRETIRLDKWLWHARFFKSRSQAAKSVSEGRVRVNGDRTDKPARAVGQGDVLTFAQGTRIRVVCIVAPGKRRGPAPEAAELYEDRTVDVPEAASNGARPTKKDRRAIDAMRQPRPD